MKKIGLTNQFVLFIITTILFFVTISCDNDMYKGCKNMPEQIIGTGEIINNAAVWYSNLDFTTFNSKEGLIITSDSLNIFDLLVSFDNRTTYNPIDFSKYTVLGQSTSGSCRVVFDRNVIKNTELKKYIYKINVIYCGTCEKLALDMNWVLIPKLEDDFTVEFLVNYEKWKNGK